VSLPVGVGFGIRDAASARAIAAHADAIVIGSRNHSGNRIRRPRKPLHARGMAWVPSAALDAMDKKAA